MADYSIDDILGLPQYNSPTPEFNNNFDDGVSGSSLVGGSPVGNLRSPNYVSGSTGWIIKTNGDVEFNDGTFRGSLSATTGAIGGFNIGAESIINDTAKFGIRSADGTYNIVLWAGDTDTNRFKAPFRVTSTGSPILDGASGSNRVLEGRTTVAGVSSTRWQTILGDSTSESGSNVGSDYKILAYSDAGGLLSTPMIITRSTGNVAFSGNLTSGGVAIPTISSTSTLTNKTIIQTINEVNSHTLVLADAGKMVRVSSPSGTARTITVPPNTDVAFPIGTRIDILRDASGGVVTIAAGSGVTVNARVGLKLAGDYAVATLFKRATDTWVAFGELVA